MLSRCAPLRPKVEIGETIAALAVVRSLPMWCKNELVTTALESERPERPEPARSGVKRGSVVKGLIKTIRPHQWVKNLFVMAPMFFHKDLFGTTTSGDPTLNLKVAGK